MNIPFKPYAPRPEQALAFYPRGYEIVEYVESGIFLPRPRSMIMGQYTQRTNRHLEGAEFMVLIVNFKPGVLFRLTGIPFFELTNSFVDAEAIFSKEIRLVNQRLCSTGDYHEMITIVEEFLYCLVGRIRKDEHPLDRVTDLIIEHPEDGSIVGRAGESFLSVRQFERKFKERMGIHPKLFERIARMNKAFRLKYASPQKDWLGIALDCGYHDYPHLAKDFNEFAGVSPNTYFFEDTGAPERYFGLRDSSL